MAGFGLVLLFLELLGEVLVVLGDELLKLLLAVLDVGLLQRRAVEGAGEALQRNLDRVRLVLEVHRGQRQLRALLERGDELRR